MNGLPLVPTEAEVDNEIDDSETPLLPVFISNPLKFPPSSPSIHFQCPSFSFKLMFCATVLVLVFVVRLFAIPVEPTKPSLSSSATSRANRIEIMGHVNMVTVPSFIEPLSEAENASGATDIQFEVCDEDNAPGRWFIYCSGRLLDAVQRGHLFPDSKTFVDKPLKTNRSGESVLAVFNQQFPPGEPISRAELEAFVQKNFDAEGHELEKCEVSDWSSNPAGLAVIVDPKLKHFALQLHSIWRLLCRKIIPEVKEEPERFSLLYVPQPFIVPGGRFREFYYWDAYWIVKGLLASGMTETTKDMLLNLLHLVEQFGFVPNGGRVYYLRRSQPPLLTAMVYEYYQATFDKKFLMEHLPTLEKEYAFWSTNRSVKLELNGSEFTMFQYRTSSNVPRPESYREDVDSAREFEAGDSRREHYRNLASAAESGWDFSTRWFANKSSLSSIETTNIVPVDLNAFLCYNLNIFSYFHAQLGNKNEETAWISAYVKFRDDFKSVFYVDKHRGWYDYNIRTKEHNTDFYPSIAVPLFTGCYEQLNDALSERLYTEMDNKGVFNFAGGIPTSLMKEHMGQQWDFPNGWSPLNHMVIEGLRKSDHPRMQQKAFLLAEKWVLSNYRVYAQSGAMWEKYDVVSNHPNYGSGGEYSVQSGFGWTNGVILDLLRTYGDRMRFEDVAGGAEQFTSSRITVTGSIAFLILFIVHLLLR